MIFCILYIRKGKQSVPCYCYHKKPQWLVWGGKDHVSEYYTSPAEFIILKYGRYFEKLLIPLIKTLLLTQLAVVENYTAIFIISMDLK